MTATTSVEQLLEALTTALTTPIDQEDAYALSERIDEVLDCAKDVVRLAEALRVAARSVRSGHGYEGRGVRPASTRRGRPARDRHEHPGEHAELAIKEGRRVEHELLAGLAALDRDGDPFRRSATLEVYRAYSDIGQALSPGRRPHLVRGPEGSLTERPSVAPSEEASPLRELRAETSQHSCKRRVAALFRDLPRFRNPRERIPEPCVPTYLPSHLLTVAMWP